MTCIRCQGLMVEDQLFDFEGTYGFMSMKGWRCVNCGRVHDSAIEQHRLARQEKVLALATGKPDYQVDEVNLGTGSIIRREA
jgi:hypothetical protein